MVFDGSSYPSMHLGTAGGLKVTLTVLQTLVVQVEAILNDRPLTYVPSELDDLQPLTPSHLLHGRQIVSLLHEQVSERELDDLTYGGSSDVTVSSQLCSVNSGLVGGKSI